MSVHSFETDGFFVTPQLLSDALCLDIEIQLTQIKNKGVGARYLLDYSWCRELAQILRDSPILRGLLSPEAVAVQCTYFEKSKEQNWLVPLHQDLSIPVQRKVDHAKLTGWSEKDGTFFVQAPEEVLQEMVAIRLHVDHCRSEDGPLRLVPGSNALGRMNNQQALNARDSLGESICPVARGEALLMRPLTLHASSKATGSSQRRVLHFVFGPKTLPYGLTWRHAV